MLGLKSNWAAAFVGCCVVSLFGILFQLPTTPPSLSLASCSNSSSGYDFLLDSSFKLHLLEINATPAGIGEGPGIYPTLHFSCLPVSVAAEACLDPLVRSLIQTVLHSLTDSLTHSRTRSLTGSLIQSLNSLFSSHQVIEPEFPAKGPAAAIQTRDPKRRFELIYNGKQDVHSVGQTKW